MSTETTAETEARLRGQGWSDGNIRWWKQSRMERSRASTTNIADTARDRRIERRDVEASVEHWRSVKGRQA